MNWIAFGFIAWLMLGLELGLTGLLEIGTPRIAPSFVMAFAVFVATFAPPRVAQWGCLILGLLVDLTFPVELTGGRQATLAGPYALGYLLACQLVLTMRGVMIRRNPLAVGALAIMAAAVAQIFVVAVYTVRQQLGDPITWHPTAEMLRRVAGSLYTGGFAVLLALVLFPLGPALGFQATQARRFARRSG